MTEAYNPKVVEKAAQSFWDERDSFAAKESKKPKYYCLSMFPYPSGKLHMGHVRNYTIGDVISRFKRMQGFNVLQPMGWDSFGLPAENAAIENDVSPKEWTIQNIDAMRGQLKSLGFSYDWNREFATSSPDYYKWEQSFFNKLFDQGLIYKKESEVNWDPVDETVLANEQVIDGKGWRSGATIEKKKIDQYFIKITDYADKLLENIQELDGWPNQVKLMQENWIGKSKGLEFNFQIKDHNDALRVFTTRPDTIFGATYCAVAMDHPLAISLIESNPKIYDFIENNKNITTSEAAIATQEKLGIDTGLKAIHPFTREDIPIWIANFILMDYGTGAVMCVPGHDQRDWEFAKKYSISIKQVIESDKDNGISDGAIEDKGILINSKQFNGLDFDDAFDSITKELVKTNNAEVKTNFRLRDWGISRQRYWGCPIPIIHCDDCGPVKVPETDLPVELPEIDNISSKGLNLSTFSDWMAVKCPKCSKDATRETDTFDTFFESSWYFARFAGISDKEMISKEANYWLPVDQYVGGIEHAILHLLYARFFNILMHENKLIHNEEPFTKLLTQGMVLADAFYVLDEAGNKTWLNKDSLDDKNDELLDNSGNKVFKDGMSKMSKSKLNGVDPKEMIDKYGADTVRLYMMFTSPPEQTLEWSENAIEGSYRFIKRFWTLVEGRSNNIEEPSAFNKEEETLRRKSHQTLKKVLKDYEERNSFNTVIAAVMELINAIPESFKKEDASESQKYCLNEAIEFSLKILSPIAPHVTLELWSKFNSSQDKSLFETSWPEFKENLILDDNFELIIQVNGKVRGKEKIEKTLTEEEIKSIALSNENVSKHIQLDNIKKVIYVKEKLINFVI